MDVEEWEYLPDARFLALDLEDGDKKIQKGKRSSYSKSVFNMDDCYFICPSSEELITDSSPRSSISRIPKNLVPVIPIQLDPNNFQTSKHGDQSVKELIFPSTEVSMMSSSASKEKIRASTVEADQDSTVSQVFFKLKETEFVDMKMDSPMSASSRGFLPQIDAGSGRVRFEDKEAEALMEIKSSPRMKAEILTVEKQINKAMNIDDDRDREKVGWEESSDDGGLNLWKWTLTGVGAICSFGFAATICILYFGNQHRNRVQQNQKIRLQLYAEGKSMKRVMEQASKLNEAISAARGVPLSRSHIALAGYYDGI